MAKKTSKAADASKAADIATQMIQERRELHAAADAALMSIASGETREHDHIEIFEILGWSGKQLETQVSRAARVFRNKAKAGTHATRKAAEQAADDAQQALKKQSPAIEEQIKALEAERQQLQAAASQTAQVVNDQQTAVKALQAAAPPWDVEKFNRRKSAAKNALVPRIGPLRSYVEVTARLAEHDPEDSESRKGIIHHCENQPEAKKCLQRSASDRSKIESVELNTPAWKTYLQERKRRCAEIRPQLAELEAELQAALDAAADCLNTYVE